MLKEEIRIIKEEIKQGITYKEISKRYGIKNLNMLAAINSGKLYHNDNENYPLIIKGCADRRWLKNCLYDILFTSDSYENIAKKYNKSYITIRKFAQGYANRQKNFLYPLRNNLKENQRIYNLNY